MGGTKTKCRRGGELHYVVHSLNGICPNCRTEEEEKEYQEILEAMKNQQKNNDNGYIRGKKNR